MSKSEDFKALWEKAYAAGLEAGKAAVPVPMHVVQRANPFDDKSPIVKAYEPVMGGVCGFAWVSLKPGNSAFANWLKKNGKMKPNSYEGGVQYWVSEFDQSMERKEAFARAMAKVLQEAGYRAYPGSRMD